jgi:hypothetical protein
MLEQEFASKYYNLADDFLNYLVDYINEKNFNSHIKFKISRKYPSQMSYGSIEFFLDNTRTNRITSLYRAVEDRGVFTEYTNFKHHQNIGYLYELDKRFFKPALRNYRILTCIN